jgi:lipopolysaccharide/colanic/teichoic acid biosynthesis glycosyltransferase
MSKVLSNDSSDSIRFSGEAGVLATAELKSSRLRKLKRNVFQGLARKSRLKTVLEQRKSRTAEDRLPPPRRVDSGRIAATGVGAVEVDSETLVSLLPRSIPVVETSWFYASIKRTVDILGASFGLLVFSPLMLLCAVAIKLQDGGPVFFWQTRIGERGERFQIVKFRSMVMNADQLKSQLKERNQHADDRTFKIFNDPRITTVGRLMRRMSLDEVPQFWNVLCGQMSLVGPRPALADEVVMYEPEHLIRLAVKPGLTCIWQVSGRSNLDFQQQMALDRQYIDQRSVLLDCSLLVKTLPAVLRGDGAA